MEQSFGLLNNNWTAKPAYTTLQNTIALLADPGAAHTPSPLVMALAGDSNTRSVLLQKRNGTYWLGVWQQTEVWNRDTLTAVNPANITATLSLAAGKTINRYNPATGTASLETTSASTYSFTSSEDVALLSLA
jgi:hypothetical protein